MTINKLAEAGFEPFLVLAAQAADPQLIGDRLEDCGTELADLLVISSKQRLGGMLTYIGGLRDLPTHSGFWIERRAIRAADPQGGQTQGLCNLLRQSWTFGAFWKVVEVAVNLGNPSTREYRENGLKMPRTGLK